MEKQVYDIVSMHFWDWLAIILLLLVLITVAVIVKSKQKGKEDFFLAGRSMNIILVLCSMFAGLFSTITFVSVPGEAYQHGLMFFTINIGMIFFIPLAIWLFLRFFFLTETFTAYEYLERRYNLPVRLTGAFFYVLVRLFYAGIVFYSGSKVFESLLGWHPLVTILGIGFFTIIYTATGGMKAIIINDTIQCFIIIIGIIAIFSKLISLSDTSVFQIYDYARDNGHTFGGLLKAEFYQLRFYDRYNFWLFMYSVITIPLVSLSADQSIVQKLLSSKGYGGAKKAVFLNSIISIPIVGMLWFVGIALFYYYNNIKTIDTSVITSDKILGYFINTELPTPLPGLITAALLAALMSTIDSTVNCIANVSYIDGFVRLGFNKKKYFNRELLVCRSISILAGVTSVIIAVFLHLGGKGIVSSIYEISALWTGLWGVLFVAFFLGVLVPRVAGMPILIGLIVGGITSLVLPFFLYYNIPVENRICFSWVTVPGCIITLILALVLSYFWPNKKNLNNLTLWTLNKKANKKSSVCEMSRMGQ